MKGLELCRRFFFEVGLPQITKDLPECLPYIAAGLGGVNVMTTMMRFLVIMGGAPISLYGLIRNHVKV